jgi:hypothetical protein
MEAGVQGNYPFGVTVDYPANSDPNLWARVLISFADTTIPRCDFIIGDQDRKVITYLFDGMGGQGAKIAPGVFAFYIYTAAVTPTGGGGYVRLGLGAGIWDLRQRRVVARTFPDISSNTTI